MIEALNTIGNFISDYILITVLLAAAIYFTVVTKGVQFRMFGEMLRLIARSGRKDNDRRDRETDNHHSISSFQAFMVSIASRVGTGNLAGVATAIAIGGPGAVFWSGSLHCSVQLRLLSSQHWLNYTSHEAHGHLSEVRHIT